MARNEVVRTEAHHAQKAPDLIEHGASMVNVTDAVTLDADIDGAFNKIASEILRLAK